MYKAYLDGEILYHPNLLDKFPLVKANLSLELNKTGTFTFTIYNNNLRYGSIQKMKSIVKVFDDDYRLFRGRVLNAKRGFYNELQVTCEGELAFLLDTKQRPYNFQGSVEEFFTFIIENHNASCGDEEKKFKVGVVTVTDPNDYITRADSTYLKTWDTIQNKLINELGGYLWTREEEDGVYIDYLADFETMNTQKVKFGSNLLDFEETIKGQDIATVIIPLGCKLKDSDGKETGERLTIAEINDGLDYIYSQEAVEKFGWIEKTVEFDDVTVVENLLRKGQEELENSIYLTRTIDLSAVDLHALNLDIQSFRLGNYTFVESEPHDFKDRFLTRKLGIDLLNMANSSLQLGDERKTFVDKQVDTNKDVHLYIGKVEEGYKNYIGDSMQVIVNQTTSTIQQSKNDILLEVGNVYYTKNDIENIVKELRTSLELADEGIKGTVSSLDKDLQDKFNLITKYFTFTINGLTIGQTDSSYKVVIDNDRYSMLVGETELLWMTAETGLHAPEMEITEKANILGYIEEMDDQGRINTRWAGDE